MVERRGKKMIVIHLHFFHDLATSTKTLLINNVVEKIILLQ